MADWKTDDNVIKATGDLAKDTLSKLTKIAIDNHIPFRELGDYVGIFIKCLMRMLEVILIDMLKDQILGKEDDTDTDVLDNLKNFNFDEEA